jgi:hypothetical protein
MVGVKIRRTPSGFELHQPNLIQKVLSEHWDGTTTHSTPLPKEFNSNFIPGEEGVKNTEYFSIIGSLNYVSVGTRPDITYAVNCLACFSSKPSAVHWKALRHLLGYLAATKEKTLQITP